MAPASLIIVERAYRGSIETQFADVLYIVRELNRQIDELHLSLRGLAVTYALESYGFTPALRVGGRELDTLPNPRASLHVMLQEGLTLWVDDEDLASFGAKAATRLLPGTRRIKHGELAIQWADYEQVWFM